MSENEGRPNPAGMIWVAMVSLAITKYLSHSWGEFLLLIVPVYIGLNVTLVVLVTIGVIIWRISGGGN